MKDAPSYIIEFDSSSSMLYALGRFLNDRDFPGAGIAAWWPEWWARAVNRIPSGVGNYFYSWGGWAEAARKKDLSKVSLEEISEWVIRQYPLQSYPAVMAGSSNGALVHLAAALGIPWLPQTNLLAVRRFLDVDDIRGDIEWARDPVRKILDKNPGLIVHQMKDPLQDRLMVARMAYFRLKRKVLGHRYRNFLESTIASSGTLISVECHYDWPVVKVSDGHFFQLGGLGGLEPEEYLHGGPRVSEFLKAQKSKGSSWDVPPTDLRGPEAEWGFAPELREDMEALCREKGWRLRRLVFEHPESLSPFVADLYRWWYERRGVRDSRLLCECFAFIDPWWTIKTGASPFWMAFNAEGSYRALSKYLDSSGVPEELYLILMSNGVPGVGWVPVEKWKGLLGRARRRGDFLGVDEKGYPSNFGSFALYHHELKKKIKNRIDFPAPLTIPELEQFFMENRGKYAVEWL